MSKQDVEQRNSPDDPATKLTEWITSLKDRMKPRMNRQEEAYCQLPYTTGTNPGGHAIDSGYDANVIPDIPLRSPQVKAFVLREYMEVFGVFPSDRTVEHILTVLESYGFTTPERKTIRSMSVLDNRHEALAVVLEELSKTGATLSNERLLERVKTTAPKVGVKVAAMPRDVQELGNMLGKISKVMKTRGVILKRWKDPRTGARGWEISRVKSTQAAIAPKLDAAPTPKDGTNMTPSGTRTAPLGTEEAPAATPDSSGVVSEDVGIGETGWDAEGDDGTSDLGNDGDGEDFTDAEEAAELRAVLNELDGSKGGAA